MNTQDKAFLGLKVLKATKEGKYLGLVDKGVGPSDNEVSWKLIDSGMGDTYFLTQAKDGPKMMITCALPKGNVYELLYHKDATADWAIAPAGKDTGKYFVYAKTGPAKVKVFLTMEGGKVFGRAYPSGKKSLFNFGDGDDDDKEPGDGKDPKEPEDGKDPKEDPPKKEPPKKDPKGKEPKKGKEPPKDDPPEKEPPKDPKGPAKDPAIKSSIWEITDGKEGGSGFFYRYR